MADGGARAYRLDQLQLAVLQEQAAHNLQAGVARLRTLYDVRVDGSL